MPTSNERKMLSSNEALKELKVVINTQRLRDVTVYLSKCSLVFVTKGGLY